jgi:hypothetical protein
MIETIRRIAYNADMKRTQFSQILRGSANDLLNSLDMRRGYQPAVVRPGATVELAWAATGRHLRKALAQYGGSASRTHH